MTSAQLDFNPAEYYSSYPSRVISRPGYPARAQFKSTLLWKLYGKLILDSLREIRSYADIGGCFGFGANALAFQIAHAQARPPITKVFEISPEFCSIGKLLFKNIDFVSEDFTQWAGDPRRFDLVSLFDVIEHIPDPGVFLQAVAARTQYALLKTPMETAGEWRGSRTPALKGELHHDGHVNFFDPGPYMRLLKSSGFEIVKWRLVPGIVPRGVGETILVPEEILRDRNLAGARTDHAKALRRIIRTGMSMSPAVFRYTRRIVGGGDHLCLVRSTTARPSADHPR